MDNYSEVIDRIKSTYKSATDEERYYFRRILEEFSTLGFSNTYEQIWLADYKEIPVDIDTFLCDDRYLGKTNRNGEAVYPYWRKVLRDIFGNGNRYEECFFTGATRIGKSSTAITGAAYMLYRLMCLRDPQAYFGKKDISKFSILFFNITKDMAKGVAFREFNDTLAASPWFMDHGRISRSERDFYYIPEGGKIDIDYGSDAAHGLGKQVYCLIGDTEIVTSEGCRKLSDLCDRNIELLQYNDINQCYELSAADVVLTKFVQDTIRITLEDGSVIEGTYDHLIMLSDGSYKKLGEITSSDDLLTLNTCGGG